MKNLILSYATNCKYDDFYRFVTSARCHCRPDDVDIVILLDALGPRFSELAIEQGVTLVPVANIWRMCQKSRLLNYQFSLWMVWLKFLSRIVPVKDRPFFQDLHRLTVADWIHPQAGRWLEFRNFLKVSSQYLLVMTSDLRDIVFQDSPFDGLDPGALHVFDQDSEPYEPGMNVDSDWVQAVYGNSGMDRLKGRKSVCCGTVLGTVGQFRRLLELMEPDIVRYRRVPLDQAIFNMVLATRYDGPVVHHSITDGPVVTIVGDTNCCQVTDGRARIGDRVVPVIHMYDRRHDLLALVEERYPVPPAPR
jgi:hypothetical protein